VRKEHERESFLENLFTYRNLQKRKIIFSLVITTIVMALELLGGFLTNSIALISDSVHMFTHSLSLIIGLTAIYIAKNPPCHHKTFGLYRAEILAAFINGLSLLALAGIIIYESIMRFMEPREVLTAQMFIIAIIGLSVNLISIMILREGHKADLNIKSIFYHMIADAVSSIGIVAVAIIIYFTDWNFLDPVASLGICFLIIWWSAGVLKESGQILLEMTPKGLEIDAIKKDIESNFPEVESIFHIHIWTITPDIIALSCFLRVSDAGKITNIGEQDRITSRVKEHLYKKYNIIEATIQITDVDESGTCAIA